MEDVVSTSKEERSKRTVDCYLHGKLEERFHLCRGKKQTKKSKQTLFILFRNNTDASKAHTLSASSTTTTRKIMHSMTNLLSLSRSVSEQKTKRKTGKKLSCVSLEILKIKREET